MENPFRLTSRQHVYRNQWITVREDRVLTPCGAEGLFGIVTLKPGSSVLPVEEDGSVYLAREYKYALGEASIEAFSGGIDPGETPLQTAIRELKEEAGMEAAEWEPLGVVNPLTSVVESPDYLFLARGLTHGSHQREDGEVIEIVHLRFEEAVRMVMDGEITHAGSAVLILKAWRLLAHE